VTALRENRRSENTYIAYIMVWKNWCCCSTHWLSNLYEIRHKKFAQNGADCEFPAYLHTEGRTVVVIHLMSVP